MGSRGNKVHRIISHEFRLVQLFRTCSNHSTTQRTSPLELSGSNRFGRVEPPRTHEKLSCDPCSLWSSLVRTGSEELNHPELMSSSTTGLVCCVVLWFEQVRKSWTTPNACQIPLQAGFPVVRTGSEELNNPELMRNYPIILVPSGAQWFEQVRKSWTTPNSWQVPPQAWFPVLKYRTNSSTNPNWWEIILILWSFFPLELSGSNRFGKVEPPQTHVKFHHRPGFLCELWFKQVWKCWTTPNACQVPLQAGFPEVRTGTEELNNPELMRNYPMIIVPSGAQWFEQVRKSWTTPNSCQVPPQAWFPVLSYGMNSSTTPNSWEIILILWSFFPLALSGSNRFGKVEPPRTHVKFHRRPGFLCELWFKQVWKSWTTPNSWEIILWSLFPLELSGSNRFGRVEPPRTHFKFHRRSGFLCCAMVWTGSEELNNPECMSSSTAGRVSCGSWKSWTTPNSCQVPPQDRFPMWTIVQTGSEELNHPELMRNYPVILVPSGAQWFEQVRKSSTTPNSCQVPPQVCFLVLSYGSNRFGRVEPPQTHFKFHRRPGFLWFEQVRKSWTTPNSWEIILWSLFPLELSGSNRFWKVEPPRTHVKFHRRPGFPCCTMVRIVQPPQTHEKLSLSYDPSSL